MVNVLIKSYKQEQMGVYLLYPSTDYVYHGRGAINCSIFRRMLINSDFQDATINMHACADSHTETELTVAWQNLFNVMPIIPVNQVILLKCLWLEKYEHTGDCLGVNTLKGGNKGTACSPGFHHCEPLCVACTQCTVECRNG